MIFQIDNVKTINSELKQEMFALRKHVFCDMLLWDIPHCDGQEADIFDFTNAYYINWLDEQDGSLLGSVRLIPMTQNNLLNTVFKDTIDVNKLAQIENNPRVWEGARLCLNEQIVQARFGSEGLYWLLYGLQLCCEDMGIQTLICNCDSLMYRIYRRLGLTFKPLGKTGQFRHGTVHCLSFEICAQNKAILKRLLPDNATDLNLRCSAAA